MPFNLLNNLEFTYKYICTLSYFFYFTKSLIKTLLGQKLIETFKILKGKLLKRLTEKCACSLVCFELLSVSSSHIVNAKSRKREGERRMLFSLSGLTKSWCNAMEENGKFLTDVNKYSLEGNHSATDWCCNRPKNKWRCFFGTTPWRVRSIEKSRTFSDWLLVHDINIRYIIRVKEW